MDDPTAAPRDRRPQMALCDAGHIREVYIYGPPDAPRRICGVCLRERYRRSNWGSR